MTAAVETCDSPKTAMWNNPRVRSAAVQVALLVAVAALIVILAHNTYVNLKSRNIASGFGFLNKTAGFDIIQSPISYSSSSSYGRAIMVGFLNTLLISVLGIAAATLIGFFMGVMRLSKNWLVSRLAACYIEFFRNVPLLLQIIFFYQVVLAPLPGPKQALDLGYFLISNVELLLAGAALGLFILSLLASVRAWVRRAEATESAEIGPTASISRHGLPLAFFGLSVLSLIVGSYLFLAWWGMFPSLIRTWGEDEFAGSLFISNRGLIMPKPLWGDGTWLFLASCAVAVIGVWLLTRWARARQLATGQTFPVLWVSLAILAGVPLVGYVIAGFPVTFEYPALKGFNFEGGVHVLPELIALFLALAVYTGTDIAESVRAGIQAVSHGQTEAASALGLRGGTTLRLVVIPQAMRVIIPPLASTYLSLTKNSTLAVAIGYPDLVAVGGTVLNQTNQAVEMVGIWMVVYLSLSLLTSLFMNWFNDRMKLVER